MINEKERYLKEKEVKMEYNKKIIDDIKIKMK